MNIVYQTKKSQFGAVFCHLNYHYLLICEVLAKNPAYGRQRISRLMRIVAPIPQ